MASILVVVADDEQRRHINESLRRNNDWEVIPATTGAEGQAKFQQNAIDLVVIDLASIGLPGTELFEWIRDDRGHVPVILLTADETDEQTKVQALVMGAASYVPQSYVARDLRVTVERILGLTGCRRRHARLTESLVTTQADYRVENNDLKMIPVLIGHLIDTAEEFGVVTPKGRMQLAVALEEAITNGIVHGNLEVPSQLKDEDHDAFYRLIAQRQRDKCCSERRLFVRGDFEQGFSRFTITDEGEGFDPAAIQDPTSPDQIDRPHGRGLFLIRAFMDEVSFNEAGNEIRLTKRAAGA